MPPATTNEKGKAIHFIGTKSREDGHGSMSRLQPTQQTLLCILTAACIGVQPCRFHIQVLWARSDNPGLGTEIT
jgi:hypothetical protein